MSEKTQPAGNYFLPLIERQHLYSFDESELNSQEYFTVVSDINSKTPVINFGENVSLFEPVEKWIEFINDTPIPTKICIDMGNLSTKVNYSDYHYKPELGAKRFLKLSSQTTDNSISRRKLLLLMAEKECKTEIRNLYGKFNRNILFLSISFMSF
ncbi:unnamed protein product [Trichobilharzia regenti]|nr:unnamed protein product [Trichobilharzia regenti]